VEFDVWVDFVLEEVTHLDIWTFKIVNISVGGKG